MRREAHARCIPSEITVGWEEYAKTRKEVKNMVEKEKGRRDDIVLKQMKILMEDY